MTIDGDPGSYPGAKPSDFLKVFLADRQTLDGAGERPEKQKLIPWIWSRCGTKGVWVEPIEPYVQATLAELKRGMPEPWELLPGRSAEGIAAMVDGWKLHRYVGGGTGDEPFQWSCADANHQAILKRWCREHVKDVPRPLPWPWADWSNGVFLPNRWPGLGSPNCSSSVKCT